MIITREYSDIDSSAEYKNAAEGLRHGEKAKSISGITLKR